DVRCHARQERSRARRGRGEGPALGGAGGGAARRAGRMAPVASRGGWLAMMRTDRAGDLRAADIGRDVVVCGWVDSRRDHGGVVFLDVRDTAGIVQVVVDPGAEAGADVHRVRNEFVVRVEGKVRHRPEGTVNETLPTGEVEVAAVSLQVLNEAETP